MKQAYKEFTFHNATARLIHYIDALVTKYVAQGYVLSVRQIYYQLVARDVVPNTERSYKRVASIINDGRLAGLIDWDAIEDRGRDVESRPNWPNGASIIDSAATSFHMDMWEGQEHRVFVIVEKAALANVLGRVCRRYDVPLLAARGYPSVSIVRELVLNYVQPALNQDQNVTILHLGDHDPSGIDMTRDLDERIELFVNMDTHTFKSIKRIALNMNQVEEYKPPPNPAKVTDSRFEAYQRQFGDESWELDALEPAMLEALVESNITPLIDETLWSQRNEQIEGIRGKLTDVAKRFRRQSL